ncbi:MAG: type III PLP-dependent enzyme [Geminicoccaceae bacterium]|nr:type III PLP-dependent enzyme [Geminicoccaceae bacterium]
MIRSFSGAAALVSSEILDGPVVAVRPQAITARASAVMAQFPGDVLYAVKCNDHPLVLEALFRGGIRHFDTASIQEIRTVRRLLPEAVCHFMHPVKSRAAIAEAYFEHGVRRFVVDHPDELAKIAEVTKTADDLEIYVRLAVSGEGALLALTGKFGCEADEAVPLLHAARRLAARVGLTFHVGSQCLAPEAFACAVRKAARVAVSAGGVDDLDVGGGFPAAYTGNEPAFVAFVAAIRSALAETGLACRLQCEPGRLLVADGASILTNVELRRGRSLYLNDGVYGNLAELKWLGPQFPLRRVGRAVAPATPVQPYDLFGPTCDSIDSMPGPHWLPADMQGGDWIEVGFMGAYSNALRTGFNGFSDHHCVILDDAPWCGTPPNAGLRRAA